MIPMDIRIEAITMINHQKRNKNKKTDFKSPAQFADHKCRNSHFQRRGLDQFGRLFFGQMRSKSFSRVLRTINSFIGAAAFSSPSVISSFSVVRLIPSSHTFSKVGAMMNIVRNKASEIRTIFGGVNWWPKHCGLWKKQR